MSFDDALRAIVRDELRKVLRDELGERKNDTRGPAAPANDTFLTYKEAAEYVGASTATIRNWVKAGWLKPCGPARTKRLRRSDIERVMTTTQHTVEPPPSVEDQLAKILGTKKKAA